MLWWHWGSQDGPLVKIVTCSYCKQINKYDKIWDVAHRKGDCAHDGNFEFNIYSVEALSCFKMTAYLLKLISTIGCYKWNTAGKFLFSYLFSRNRWKQAAKNNVAEVPFFNVCITFCSKSRKINKCSEKFCIEFFHRLLFHRLLRNVG